MYILKPAHSCCLFILLSSSMSLAQPEGDVSSAQQSAASTSTLPTSLMVDVYRLIEKRPGDEELQALDKLVRELDGAPYRLVTRMLLDNRDPAIRALGIALLSDAPAGVDAVTEIQQVAAIVGQQAMHRALTLAESRYQVDVSTLRHALTDR